MGRLPALRRGQLRIGLCVWWPLLGAALAWAIAALLVPLVAPGLSPGEAWVVAIGVVSVGALCLVGHGAAHVLAARLVGAAVPSRLPLYPFGDAAQTWPPAPAPASELAAAAAGPVFNLLAAALCYLVWDWQLNAALSVGAIVLALFNAGMAVANLAPGWPFDGGRLARAIVWGLVGRLDWGDSLAHWLGRLLASALAAWGVALVAQQARFSPEAGSGTLLAAALLGLALWRHGGVEHRGQSTGPALPPSSWLRLGPDPSSRLRLRPEAQPEGPGFDRLTNRVACPERSRRAEGNREPRTANRNSVRCLFLRWFAAGLLVAGMAAVPLCMLPMLHGLYAPGFAVAVQPMITVAEEYHHPSSGSFLLTTVVGQTPILLGQWLYGQIDPAIEIVPPERIVPPDTTPRDVVRRNFRMLEESEAVATVVALRLAGFDAAISNEDVEVVTVLPESPAAAVLRPGDRIVSVDGEAVTSPESLRTALGRHDPATPVALEVLRDGARLALSCGLIPPVAAGGPPRLGVTVQAVGLDLRLPFAVAVAPQKIVGGPSAGLMFTLTIYDLVTPGDLTGGRRIAGTGTIDREGRVGPIGGVAQKVAGAEWAGATYFLVPPENYADAARVARRIKVVQVQTAREAIAFLRSLP